MRRSECRLDETSSDHRKPRVHRRRDGLRDHARAGPQRAGDGRQRLRCHRGRAPGSTGHDRPGRCDRLSSRRCLPARSSRTGAERTPDHRRRPARTRGRGARVGRRCDGVGPPRDPHAATRRPARPAHGPAPVGDRPGSRRGSHQPRPHQARARDHAVGCLRTYERRDCAQSVGDGADGQVPPHEHLPQARRREPDGGHALRGPTRAGIPVRPPEPAGDEVRGTTPEPIAHVPAVSG